MLQRIFSWVAGLQLQLNVCGTGIKNCATMVALFLSSQKSIYLSVLLRVSTSTLSKFNSSRCAIFRGIVIVLIISQLNRRRALLAVIVGV